MGILKLFVIVVVAAIVCEEWKNVLSLIWCGKEPILNIKICNRLILFDMQLRKFEAGNKNIDLIILKILEKKLKSLLICN